LESAASIRELPRLLIADPDRDTRELYSDWFRQNGYDVVQASNGRDALEKALATRLSLVITETWLPQVDGFALCQHLRQRPETSGVPIIIVTADARPAALDRAFRAGANVVLVKPVTPDDVFNDALLTIRLAQELDDRRNTVLEPGSLAPPQLDCPECGSALRCQYSYVDVADDYRQQRDHYRCPGCARHFEYGHAARKLRETG
jgi:CheY-like chemotaxis protein